MPTSDPGNSRRRAAVLRERGFTLIELLVVAVLIAIGAAVVSLALRDRSSSRLDEEGARLAALLEGARTEARAAGLAVRWMPARLGDAPGLGAPADADFRFTGLPPTLHLPTRWLDAQTSAQVVGGNSLLLGPDAILPAQRVVLALGERRVEVGTDGLAPFAVRTLDEAGS